MRGGATWYGNMIPGLSGTKLGEYHVYPLTTISQALTLLCTFTISKSYPLSSSIRFWCRTVTPFGRPIAYGVDPRISRHCHALTPEERCTETRSFDLTRLIHMSCGRFSNHCKSHSSIFPSENLTWPSALDGVPLVPLSHGWSHCLNSSLIASPWWSSRVSSSYQTP